MCSSAHMSSLTKNPRFLAEEEKDMSKPQTEMVLGLETEKEGLCFIIVKLVLKHPGLDV